jgi:retron-type reverse transcriptase
MKRIGNIYDAVISAENLMLADEKARRGKVKCYGVKKHDENREVNIERLHQMLSSDEYKTSKYHVFTIVDKGKVREIYRLPYFPDRICHHAIMNIMEPIWTSIMTRDTYSCLKGRGIHGVVKAVKKGLKSGDNDYCLKIDVRKFYPSINHDILKALIRKKLKDKRLLSLLDEIIDSAPGVPIGNYLSQFFANIYLSYFDHWIKEVLHVRCYYRYADDIVILSDSKKDLHGVLVAINHYFMERLKLQLKGNYQIFPINARGIDFVGYRFYHTHTLLRKSIKKNMCRKAARLKNLKLSESDYKQAMCSHTGLASHCDSKHLLKKTIG